MGSRLMFDLFAFCQVVEETAFLIAKWTSVGFVHGVMNTDNLRYLKPERKWVIKVSKNG